MSGRREAAAEILEETELGGEISLVTLRLAQSNLHACIPDLGLSGDPDAQLSCVNEALEHAGLTPIARRDAAQPPRVGNIVSEAPAVAGDEGRVTVIIPLHNSEDTIEDVLDSLVRQTWQNIEIIVVDDASTDSSAERAAAFAARNDKVRVLRLRENSGSYTARNAGVAEATGDFITTHDSNDWSHPSKIELQIRHLLDTPQAIANYSFWSRTIGNLVVTGKFRARHSLVDWNPSSFMVRREVFERLGGWDPVRFSADAEFVRRVRASYPDREIGMVLPEAPLAFSLDLMTSLTKTGESHGKTINHGFRRTYREASDHWLGTIGQRNPWIGPDSRAFPVPGVMLPKRRKSTNCDILIISDFSAAGRDIKYLDPEYRRLQESGRSIGIFHWVPVARDVTAPPRPQFMQAAQDGQLRIFAPGETIHASHVVFLRVMDVHDPIDAFPKLSCETLWAIRLKGMSAERLAQSAPAAARLCGAMSEPRVCTLDDPEYRRAVGGSDQPENDEMHG
jgi:glycosyltransferase involved in cell wall biosynthesis